MAEEYLKTRPTYSPDTSKLPLSPHLQIWKWTPTMASSILHRATGIVLYTGSVLFALWLISAAVSEDFYSLMATLIGSPIGMVIMISFTWTISFHLCNGIKYLFWDAGKFIQKETAKKVVIVVFLLSVVMTAVIWIAALGMKG